MGDSRGRLRRRSAVAVAGILALFAGACVPPTVPPPATTTSTTSTTIPDITIPGFTYQLPSFSLDLPSVDVGFSGCSASYNPPSFGVTGPTLVIPETTVPANGGVLPLPGVQLNSGAASISLGSVTISCLFVSFTSGVVVNLGGGAASPSATLDLNQGKIIVGSSTLSLSASLVFQGFGGLTIPLANQTVVIPGAEIPLP